MAEHRRPAIPFTDAPRGSCRWCGKVILHDSGEKKGEPNLRRRWHPTCVDTYNATDPRELRRRARRRDRGVCAVCRLDTYALKRRLKGPGMRARLRERGFVPGRSLWELDHIVPLIEGGGHELANLQTLCVPCHRAKSAQETRARACARADDDAEAQGRELDRLLDRIDGANARLTELLNEHSRPPATGESRR